MPAFDQPPPLFVPAKPAIIRRANPGFFKEPYPAIVPGVQPSPGLYSGMALEGFSWTYLQTQTLGSGTSFNQAGVNFGAPSLSRRVFAVVHSIRGSGVNLNLTGTPTIGGVNATIHTSRSQFDGNVACGLCIFSAEVSEGTSGSVTWRHAGTAGGVFLSMYRMVRGAGSPTIANTGAQTNNTQTGIIVSVPNPGVILFGVMGYNPSPFTVLSLDGMDFDRNVTATGLSFLGSKLFPSGDSSSARTVTYSTNVDNIVSNWLTWGAAA